MIQITAIILLISPLISLLRRSKRELLLLLEHFSDNHITLVACAVTHLLSCQMLYHLLHHPLKEGTLQEEQVLSSTSVWTTCQQQLCPEVTDRPIPALTSPAISFSFPTDFNLTSKDVIHRFQD